MAHIITIISQEYIPKKTIAVNKKDLNKQVDGDPYPEIYYEDDCGWCTRDTCEDCYPIDD